MTYPHRFLYSMRLLNRAFEGSGHKQFATMLLTDHVATGVRQLRRDDGWRGTQMWYDREHETEGESGQEEEGRREEYGNVQIAG